MTDLGDISHYLGMEVDYVVGEKITLCQSTYLKKVLVRFKMTGCKPVTVPMNPRVANFLLPYDNGTSQLSDPLCGRLYIPPQILLIQ